MMKTRSLPRLIPVAPLNVGAFSVTAGYYAAFIVLGMCAAILGPTLPGLAEQTNSSIKSLSFLFTARSLGYILGALIGGRVFDEAKGHPIMAAMLLATAGILALVPITSLLGILIVLMLLLGITECAVDVGGNTLLVWLHKEKVGSFMNGLHFFFGIGAFFAPIVIAQVLIHHDNIAWAYWFLAILVIPVAIALFYLPSPSIPKKPVEQTSEIEHPLMLAGIVLFFFLYVGAEVGFGGWIYLYAIKAELANKTSAAYLTSTFWGAFTITRLISIPLAMKFKPVVLLYANLAGCLLSIGLILLIPGSFYALLFGSIGVGMFMATIFPTTLSFAERRMSLTGKLTSWFFVGGSAGAMTFPWLIGQLLDIHHSYMMIVLIGILLSALAVLSWISLNLKPITSQAKRN